MPHSAANDPTLFYQTPEGRVIRRLILTQMRVLWPDLKGLDLGVFGLSAPYAKHFKKDCRTCLSFTELRHENAALQSHYGACLTDFEALPLPAECLDRAILIHALEHVSAPKLVLDSIYRVLRPEGELLVVVPNRSSRWSQGDWSPFGHGLPYSAAQLYKTVKQTKFEGRNHRYALYGPPVKKLAKLKIYEVFERFGPYTLPMLGGVHIMQLKKRISQPVRPDKGSAVATVKAPAARPA